MFTRVSCKILGALSHTNKVGFAIRSSYRQIIQKTTPVTTEFSREYLKKLSETPDYEAVEKLRLEEEHKKTIEESIFKLKANDKNPSNIIKVKLNSTILNISQGVGIRETDKVPETSKTDTTPIENSEGATLSPSCIISTPRKQNPSISGTRRRIPVSFSKMRPALGIIKKKHLFDAISLLSAQKKLSCQYLLKALQQVRRHAKVKNMDENRLYVAGVILGKSRRFYKMRYHAKGRAGTVSTDISQVTIKLEEKPVDEMFRLMVQGKRPPMLAYMIREKFAQEEVDLERIRKNSFILTAKGRQQKKLMLKRKVLARYYEFRKKGVKVPLKVIRERIVNEEAAVFAEEYNKAASEMKLDSYNARLVVYKKNTEKTG